MDKPKILVFDIELAPITAYVWGRRDVNIALNQIKKEWSVIAWAAKWLGESKVWYEDQRRARDIGDDKKILQKMWSLLNEADIVITQNGQSFDSRKLNARFIMNGMKPPSPYKHLDTYRIIRRVADFTSHKLEYLTDKLCTKYKKLAHANFPGMQLWTECLNGNMKAWDEMKRYNIHDVLSTEELYNKIKAWTPAAQAIYFDRGACEVCHSRKLMSHGIRCFRVGKFRFYRCNDCAHVQKGGKVK